MFKMLGAKKDVLEGQHLEPRVKKLIEEGLDMVEEAKDLWFDEEKFINQGVEKGVKKGMRLGVVRGREEGREEATHQLILNLLRNMAPKEVASRCKLPLSHVMKIKKSNGRKA